MIYSLRISSSRIYGLDFLRCLAILFVVFGHGAYLMEWENYMYVNYFLFDGVAIFFVLSGFLIGRILLNLVENPQFSYLHLIDFWLRRWLRTLPNYLLILLILFGLNLLFTNGFQISNYFSYFIFSQNLINKHPDFFPEAWSLSIEEWFYLLTPILLFVGIVVFKINRRWVIFYSILLLLIGSTFIRYSLYAHGEIVDGEAWAKLLSGRVVTRLDSIMYGVIGAVCSKYYRVLWFKFKNALFFVGLLLFLFIKFSPIDYSAIGFFNSVFSFSLISIATLFLLPFLSHLKNGKGLVYKIVTFISLISYPMYLVNLSIVQYWILNIVDWDSMTYFNSYFKVLLSYFLYWLLTIGLAFFIYRYFEKPIMRFRSRLRII
ncbi:Peptidoglycan/LPS O-acetylase OafA/YrhL, contains acyltransferase and SGNH-hydrolase domains [Nonlabens sp. Hel1_33_55]|nr:Peptidoglycan/LPS O-acetylase OafA/YrhL, contains acyltransferase and SGNH-hydrolase domains [Nonlabens sp. Hel1_33_55]